MTWLFLALLAPLLFGIVTLIDDNLLQNFYRSPALATAVTGVFGILPAIVIIALANVTSLPIGLVILSAFAGILITIYYYFYFIGLDSANPSVVAALFCLSPALVPFLAYFIVDERLSVAAIVGLITIVVAAVLYSLTDNTEGRIKISKALIPIVFASIIFDIASVANKYVYDRSDFYSAYIYFCIGTFVGGLIFALYAYKRKEFPKVTGHHKTVYGKVAAIVIITELINVLAEYTHDKALSLGQVSLVNVLDNLQPLYVLLLTIALYPILPRLFREGQSEKIRLKLLLAITIVVGAYIAVR